MYFKFAFVVTMVVVIAISCKKDDDHNIPPPSSYPAMEYFGLNDFAIKSSSPGFSLDVNNDGRKDIAFRTMLTGDPINQLDKLHFVVLSNIAVNLPVNAAEEAPMMNKGDMVPPGNFSGFNWFELSSISLAHKIMSANAPVKWEGNWKTGSHRYLPYQVNVNGDLYNGWVELSMDMAAEKMILHKAAISKESNKIITAGQ